MEPIKGTLKEVISFTNASVNYLSEYPNEKSKLTYALLKQAKKYTEKIKPILEELNSIEIPSLRHRAASVDSEGNLIEKKTDFKTGTKGEESTSLRYAYKPEKLITLEKEIQSLTKKYEDKEIEIEPPYKEEPGYLPIPDKFDFKYLEAFKKFIFNPEISEEEEMNIFMNQTQKEKQSIISVLNGQ